MSEGAGYRGETETPTEVLHALTSWAVAVDIELPGLQVTRPTLEDVYLLLTRAS